jgi:hypothetical protein
VTSSGADVAVDGRFVGRAPIASPPELTPGPHVVSVSAPGRRPVSRTVRIERGEPYTLRVDLEPTAQRVVARWTLAGAGAFALAGGVSAILALVAEADAKDARSGLPQGRTTPDDAARSNDALARRDRFRTLSLASFGVSAVAGATGMLLFVFDNPAPRAPAADATAKFGLRYTGAF